MDDKNSVPYIVYEGEQARHERTVKRLVVALVVAILLLFATNAMWLWAWMQYDYVGEEVTTVERMVDVDAQDGIANYIGNNGDIINGSSSGKDEDGDAQDEGAEEGGESWDEG